jgi:hypothetical protein
MSYIYPAPGNAGAEVTLKIEVSGDTTPLSIAALQDVTINNSNDVFTWTQLDSASKKQVATTATNSLSMNLVLDQTSFFGTTSAGNVAVSKGVFGLSKDKTKIAFDLYLGDEDDGTSGKYVSGQGYVTGLAPTVSADSPVWVSPITITVDGDYTVGDTATVA